MDKQFKILVLVIPAQGHFLPMTSFVHELAKNKNVKIVFPNNECNRKLIEKTSAEFRPLEVELVDPEFSPMQWRKNFPIDRVMKRGMMIADDVLPKLCKLVDEENFDLIIYDFGTSYGKWLKQYMNAKFNQGKIKNRPPPFMMFCPSFMIAKDIYPNKAEGAFFPAPKMSLMLIVRLLIFAVKYIFFSWKHGFKVENPIDFVLLNKEELNICSVIPELQPRAYLYPKSIVFVGSCASEELRESKAIEEPLKSFLEPFERSNPVPMINLKIDEAFIAKRTTKLIYASFGTFFNEDIRPFLDIIDGFDSIEQSESNKLKLLVSTGEKTYAQLQEMIKKGELKISDNILLMSSVPQLDVLKRASLFITHAGMGSASEALHYGVPVVCIPVFGDQTSVAYSLTDELGLGLRLSFDDLNSQKIREAVNEVLNDKMYLERVTLYSQISRKYNGPLDATKKVLEYLQILESRKQKINSLPNLCR